MPQVAGIFVEDQFVVRHKRGSQRISGYDGFDAPNPYFFSSGRIVEKFRPQLHGMDRLEYAVSGDAKTRIRSGKRIVQQSRDDFPLFFGNGDRFILMKFTGLPV